ncbi:MAG: Glucosyltransferase-I precursor [Labilithrix sp.]|nr:Glucosyltransferase-I precursor [Labilithrix sp.]
MMRRTLFLVASAALLTCAACGSESNEGADGGAPEADAAGGGPDLDGGAPTDGATPGDGAAGDGGPGDGGPAVTGDFCVEDGWCWQRPTPFGTNLAGVWGSAPGDVWAVGARGTIVRHDGTRWKLAASGVRADLTGICGTSKNDVWAVGAAGTLLHFDGATWSSKASPTTKRLNGVTCASAADVHAVGDEDTRLHWDGATWTLLATVYPAAAQRPNQYGVWASPAGEAWSAGVPYAQSVPHRTGGAWTTTTVDYVSSFSASFRSVWGSSPNDVWMTGDPGGQGSLQRWNGTRWTNVYPPDASLLRAPSVAVTGSGANDVWFFGGWYGSGRWDGAAFVPQPDLQYEYLTGGWVHPSGDGWAIGYGGRMAHKATLTGGWTFTSGSPSGPYDSLSHVAVLGENDAWAVGRLSMSHWNGTTWNDVPAANTVYRQEFNDVWGSGPNDVWATSWGSGAPDNLQHWNGTAWTVTPHPGPSYLDAVWGSAANDVWVACNGGGMHFDGASWTATGGGPGGVAIHGSAKNDVWSVGYDGVARHFDGAGWTAIPTGTTEDLYAVHAFGPTDAWAAGAGGVVRRWNGAAWSAVKAPPFEATGYDDIRITALAGKSSSDVWAASASGEVFHWDGATWKRSAWLSVPVYAIARTPAGALFTAGANGAIFRRAP